MSRNKPKPNRERSAPAADSAARSSNARRRRVLLVDDHPMTLAGVAQLVSQQADLEVVGQARTPGDALDGAQKLRPELVITDLTMTGGGGLELIKNLRAICPNVRVLVLSMHDEHVYAERTLHAGAHGYIMKEAGPEPLLAAIQRVLSGGVYVSAALAESVLRSFSSHRREMPAMATLSDRELEVFELIGYGKRTQEIADELHLSPKTVEAYRARLRLKLKCDDARLLLRQAVCWVEQLGERGNPGCPPRES